MRFSKIEISLLLALVAVPLFAFGEAWWSSGGVCKFSPDTAEFRYEREWILLGGNGPSFRSAPIRERGKLMEFLIAKQYIRPLATDNPRWLLVYHANPAWKDGQTYLYYGLLRNQVESIQWSEENPELAESFWATGFALLRANSREEQELGSVFMMRGRRYKTKAELEQFLEEILPGYKLLDASS